MFVFTVFRCLPSLKIPFDAYVYVYIRINYINDVLLHCTYTKIFYDLIENSYHRQYDSMVTDEFSIQNFLI